MTFAGFAMFDFDVSQVDQPKGFSIKGAPVFSDLIAGVLSATTKEKIGTVSDVLRDSTGRMTHLVVDLGFKKVLLPAKRFWIARDEARVYASGLTREQVELMPEFKSEL